MPSSFATRFEDVARPRLDDFFGEAITLTRGSNSTEGVIARCVFRDAVIQTAESVKTSHADREWIVVKAEYVIDESAVTPSPGDRLTTDGGATWEVMATRDVPAKEEYGGVPVWLVRTKQITVT
jgi:hypothetical protein